MHTVGVHHVCHDVGRHVTYGFFLANIESQRTLSVRYFTSLSQQMLTAIKLSLMTNFVFSSKYTGTSCMQHSQTAGDRTLNFTSFNYGLQLNSPAVKPTDYEI